SQNIKKKKKSSHIYLVPFIQGVICISRNKTSY
ncbi:hypothetical protein, partial [Plasmodium yoelii yoelii]